MTIYDYYQINKKKSNEFFVHDGEQLYFIDKLGNQLNKGVYRGYDTTDLFSNYILLSKNIVGFPDYLCLDTDGNIIWTTGPRSSEIVLENGIMVKEVMDHNTLFATVIRPEFYDMPDPKVQSKLNRHFEKVFELETVEGEEEWSVVDNSFDVSLFGDVLKVKTGSYTYPIGAAHGMYSEEYLYPDVETGTFYELQDMMVDEQEGIQFISDYIYQEIMTLSEEEGEDAFLVEEGFLLEWPLNFRLEQNGLEVYFQQGEILLYATAMPSFRIPYADLSPHIDENSPFWQRIKPAIELNMDKESIDKSMKMYLEALTYAINVGNPDEVTYLFKENSPLVKKQRDLVLRLHEKGIKEKYIGHEIHNLYRSVDENHYEMIVLETIGITSAKGNYREETFKWIYTFEFDDEDDRFHLIDLRSPFDGGK